MSHSKKIFHALSWHSFMLLTMGIMQAVVTAILARHISPEDFGRIGSTTLIIGFLSVFSYSSIIRTIIKTSDFNKDIFNTCFSYSALISTTLYISLNLFANNLTFLAELNIDVLFLKILAALLVINSIGAVVEAALEKEFNLKPVSITNLIAYFIGFGVVGISAAVLGYGVWALAAAMITQATVKSLLLFRYRPFKFGFTFTCSNRDELLKFNTGITLSNCIDYIAQYIDKLFVLNFFGTTALGAYQMAFTVSELIRRFIGSVIEKTIYPSFSHYQDNNIKLNQQYIFSIEISCLVLSIVGFYMLANVNQIIAVLLGEQWSDVAPLLSLLLLQVPLRAVTRITDSYINALGGTYSIFARKILYLLVLIPSCLIGKPYGMVGIMLAVTLSVLFSAVASIVHIYLLKRINITSVIVKIISGITFGFTTYIINYMSLNYILPSDSIALIQLVYTMLITTIILSIVAYTFRRSNIINTILSPLKTIGHSNGKK